MRFLCATQSATVFKFAWNAAIATLSLTFAVAEMPPEYQPPFAAQQRTAHTKFSESASAAYFKGNSLNLAMFNTGNVQVFLPDNNARIGGIIAKLNGKEFQGKRQSDGNNKRSSYGFTEQPELKEILTLRPDGKVRFSFVFPKEKKFEAIFSLIAEYFGGSTIEIDGKKFDIAPYQAGIDFQTVLWNGPAKNIVFFADSPEKRFEFSFESAVRIRLGNSSARYGIELSIRPEIPSGKCEFSLEPGTSAGNASPAPVGYLTKVESYDFWTADRLRLPFRNGKNLLQNHSFEQGFASLFFHQYTGGKFSRELWDRKPIQIDSDPKQAFDGQYSLRILSDAPIHSLDRALISTHPVILPPGEYTMSVYARTDKPGEQTLNLTCVHLPPGGRVWDTSKNIVKKFQLSGEWCRYELTFRVPVTTPQIFHLSAASDVEAICHVDAMQLEAGSTATAYEPAVAEGRLITSASDNLIEYGKKVDAVMEVTAAPQRSGKVEITVRDFFGTIRHKGIYQFCADARGKARIALPLDDLSCGIFVVENNYRLDDGSQRYEFTRFAIMGFLNNEHRHKDLFVNAYIDPYGNKQNFPEVLDRYRKIGIGARSGFANSEKLVAEEAAKFGVDSLCCPLLRKDKGDAAGARKFKLQQNIVWWDSVATHCQEQVRARFSLPNNSPDALQKLEDAAAEQVASAPWVKIWEPFVEIEGNTPEFAHSNFASEENYRQYVEMELAVARGIKRGNPAALVGNSPTSCLRPDRFETLDKLLTTIGDRFRYDCIVVHTYREAPEYPDLDADFQTLFGLLKKHGYANVPIYCPEGMHWKPYRMEGLVDQDWVGTPWGPFSYDMGHQERIASAWRARQWLLGLKLQDRVKSMNSSTNFWGFEMDPGLTPYATQKISNTLGRLLGNATFIKDIRFSGDTRCFVFEDEQARPVAALWSCSPDVDRGTKRGPELQVPSLHASELFDMMEAGYSLSPGNLMKLRLTSFPVFLRGGAGDMTRFLAELEAAELIKDSEMAVESTFKLINGKQGAFTFTNPGRRTFNGVLSLQGKENKLTLASGSSKTLPVMLPAVLAAEKLNYEALSFQLKQSAPYAGEFSSSEKFAAIRAKRVAEPMKIDGSLADWEGIPAIPITQRIIGDKFRKSGKVPTDSDLSAELRMAWDEENLYLAVSVVDDKFQVRPQPFPEDGWRNDSLQLFFDTLGNGRSRKGMGQEGLGPGDWSYGIFFVDNASAPYTYRFHVPDIQLTEGVEGAKARSITTDVKTAFARTPNGYIYEMAFPFRTVMPIKLKAGEYFGLGVMVNDSDSDSPAPDSRLVFGITPVGYNNRPDLWPVVMLTDE